MLQLNKEGRALLSLFADPPVMSKDVRAKYRSIESAYGRLLQILVFVNQDALSLLPRDNIDDLKSCISRIYESLMWARKSLVSNTDDGYTSVDWVLISDREDGMVTEAFKLVSSRLIKSCPANLFLENSLIRLMNAYNIASDVTKLSVAIMNARQRRNLDPKKKRSGQTFILESTPQGEVRDISPMTAEKLRRIVDGGKAI